MPGGEERALVPPLRCVSERTFWLETGWIGKERELCELLIYFRVWGNPRSKERWMPAVKAVITKANENKKGADTLAVEVGEVKRLQDKLKGPLGFKPFHLVPHTMHSLAPVPHLERNDLSSALPPEPFKELKQSRLSPLPPRSSCLGEAAGRTARSPS